MRNRVSVAFCFSVRTSEYELAEGMLPSEVCALLNGKALPLFRIGPFGNVFRLRCAFVLVQVSTSKLRACYPPRYASSNGKGSSLFILSCRCVVLPFGFEVSTATTLVTDVLFSS